MPNNNDFNKVQINETIEKDTTGKVKRTSLMINIRSNKIDEAEELYRQLTAKLNQGNSGPSCECGSPMVLRQGKKGAFYGCSAFPQCRKTKELNEAEEKGVKLEAEPLS